MTKRRMSPEAAELKKLEKAALQVITGLLKQGNHGVGCTAVRGKVEYDPECNLCNATKTYTQAKATLADFLAQE